MELLLCMLLSAGTPAGEEYPESYLLRLVRALECGEADVPGMVPLAEAAAARLARGGRLWAGGNAALVSEISGRAGGFMMIRPLGNHTPATDDVLLFFSGPEKQKPPEQEGALQIQFGGVNPPAETEFIPNHAAACGLSVTLADTVQAWLFTGELIAALTRLGKMPVIYESIGAYGGNPRIQQYRNGEIPFHDNHEVTPVEAGAISKRFVEITTEKARRAAWEEHAKMARAAAWAVEAQTAGRNLFMYSMGHLFPDEIEKTAIGKYFRSAVWNAGFRHPAPSDTYAEGDLAVLIGYQHPAEELLARARPAGARVVYLSLYPSREYRSDPDVIWIDPMWDWADACVFIEGYDVPLLAASGLMNGAIAWEIFRMSFEKANLE